MTDRIRDIVKKMTLKDKIALCSGKNFWMTKDFVQYGIPSMFMCDGPHGLRKQESEGDVLDVSVSRPATCFPAAVTTGMSWDEELLEEIGGAIAEEARDQRVGLVLGPGANLKRNPLCGRNFEYFSEDPFIAGKLAAAFIRGIEKEGTGSSLKHYAANSQEYCRFTSDGVMDERTMRELYLTGFETAVKEGKPATIMCSYPKLNGKHLSESRELLTDILRDEWGYKGLVVTDWGAMYDRIKSFQAGCDLGMPGGGAYMEKDAYRAVKNGTLDESDIDRSAERILALVFRAEETLKNPSSADYDAHHALAKKAAASGAVLLKNENGLLPLREGMKIAVIGHMAKEPRFQGAGSSHINPTRLDAPLNAFPGAVFIEGCDERGETDPDKLEAVKKAASEADAVLVFAGLPDRYESEGFDREDMKMPAGHIEMIEAAAGINPNTAVILLTGSAVETPWADRVDAILYMGLMGQAGGEAVADLVYGKTNPSGKLTESWPFRYEDCPSSPWFAKEKDALYREGLYVGYRYYDRAKKEVRFPFGHGLSYTSFEYSGLSVSENEAVITVRNTGIRTGAEVVQLYVEAPMNGIHRPLRELKGFQKVTLNPGESRTVSIPLTKRSFAVWQDGWKVPKGEYTVWAGSSSRDLRLSEKICLEGDEVTVPDWQKGSWQETLSGIPSTEELEKMTGRPYTPSEAKKGSFTMDSTLEEMKDSSFLMKILYDAVVFEVAKGFGGKPDPENPNYRMTLAASVGGPIRNIMISGGIKGGLIPGLVEIANGRFFRGIGKMIRG